jgi:hypothetical protein
MAWHAKEVVRSIYEITDDELASEFVEQLGQDLQDHHLPARGALAGAHHRSLAGPKPIRLMRLMRLLTASASVGSPTTAPACCSTPASRTGHYSPRSLPAEIR